MSVKRAKGRPARGLGEVGRERILENARALFRARSTVKPNRQDIARAAGVTPALVTYYFPEQSALIENAAMPILQTYIIRLKSILQSNDGFVERLKGIVMLFIEFSSSDSGILDVYLSYLASVVGSNPIILLESLADLISFFEEGAKHKAWRHIDPTFVLFAIWGMCKMVAESPMLPVHMFSGEQTGLDVREMQASLVVELLISGIGSNLADMGQTPKIR